MRADSAWLQPKHVKFDHISHEHLALDDVIELLVEAAGELVEQLDHVDAVGERRRAQQHDRSQYPSFPGDPAPP